MYCTLYLHKAKTIELKTIQLRNSAHLNSFKLFCMPMYEPPLLLILHICLWKSNKLQFTQLICLVCFSVLFIMVAGIVVAALKDVQKAFVINSDAYLSWGFGVSITASLLYLASCIAVCLNNT